MLNLKQIQKYFFVVLATALLISCTRKDDTSLVSISVEDIVEQSNKSSKILGSPGSQAVTMADVNMIRINISGEGMQKIIWGWDGENGGSPPSVISLPVPRGTSRLFQAVAIFEDNEAEVFQYGDYTAEISAETTTIPINMTRIGGGASTQVRVAGRYEKCSICDGSDTIRPSGNLLMEYLPPGKPPMTIEKFTMLGGWFRLVGMVGPDFAPFKYTLEETGEVIFDNVDFRQSNAAANNPFRVDANANKVRIEIPPYYIHQGNGDFRFSPPMEVIIGNFIKDTDTGTFLSSIPNSIATVKYNANYSNFSAGTFNSNVYSKIYDDDAYTSVPTGTLITWATVNDSPSPNPLTINRVDGGTPSGGNCVSDNINNFSNQLCIFGHLYDNDAHDSLGFEAPFKYYVTETGYTAIRVEYINDSALLRFQLLPGVEQSGSNPYGLTGIEVFVARNTDPYSDEHIRCEAMPANYSLKGNITGGLLSTTSTTGYRFSGASASDHILLCPYTFNGITKKYFDSQSVDYYDYSEYYKLAVYPADGNNTLVGNTCKEWRVQVQTRHGSNTTAEGPIKVNLVLENAAVQATGVNTYSSSNCLNTMGVKEIPSGQGSFSFWVKNMSLSPNLDLKVFAISEMAKFAENYIALTTAAPAAPNELSSIFAGYDTMVGSCTPIKVRLRNSSGPVYSFKNTDTTVSLGLQTPAAIPGKFYSDHGCETEITQTVIPANHNSKLIYYKSGASVTDTSEALLFTSAGLNQYTATIDLWVESGFSGQLLSLITNTAGYVEPGSCTKIKLGIKHTLANMFLFKNTDSFSSTIGFASPNLYTNDSCSPGTVSSISPINYTGPFSMTYSFASPANNATSTITTSDPISSNSLNSSTTLKTIRPVKLYIEYSIDSGTSWVPVPGTNTISSVPNGTCMLFSIRIMDSGGLDYTANPSYDLFGNYSGDGGPGAGDQNIFVFGTGLGICSSGGQITTPTMQDLGGFAANDSDFLPASADLRFAKTASGSGAITFHVVEGANPILQRVIQISGP